MAKTIRSDSNSSDSHINNHETLDQRKASVGLPNVPESHVKHGSNDLLRDATSTISPSQDAGIARYDAIVVPRYASNRILNATTPHPLQQQPFRRLYIHSHVPTAEPYLVSFLCF